MRLRVAAPTLLASLLPLAGTAYAASAQVAPDRCMPVTVPWGADDVRASATYAGDRWRLTRLSFSIPPGSSP